jgi:prepilin-type N-terminal cleavage/methylation domain-containing protein
MITLDFKNRTGFTMVELLIVVLMISILSGIVVTVMNVPRRQRESADAITRSMIQKSAESVESYRTIEGTYPLKPSIIPDYIIWPPTQPEGVTYAYQRFSDSSGFLIYAASQADSTKVLKYDTTWRSVRECTLANSTVPGSCHDTE